MAPEYDMSLGFGLEAAATAVSSPYYHHHHHHHHSSSSPVGAAAYQLYGMPSVDALRIDDLLDFPAAQEGNGGGGGSLFGGDASSSSSSGYYGYTQQQQMPYYTSAAASNSAGLQTGNVGGYYSCSSLEGDSTGEGNRLFTLPEDIFVPREEEAELEWLSKFMEEDSTSFACNPFPAGMAFGAASAKQGSGTGSKPSAIATDSQQQQQNGRGGAGGSSVPGRARSKRSRAPAGGASHHSLLTNAGTAWSSSATLIPPACATAALHSQAAAAVAPAALSPSNALSPPSPPPSSSSTDGVRRCTHCLSEKTPQWRMGPMGPKTLCNACGVRYKSGRLVPEYRPASSPTFVLTQHSNSHRKVLELRRQKEVLIRHNQSSPSSSPISSAHYGGGAPHFEVR